MSLRRSAASAPLLEVFASLQGEGLWVGTPQIFVRLAGCPLRCRYCDTPHSWVVRPGATWVGADEVLERVASAEGEGARRSVSLTGGEPLAWPDFALELARRLAPRALHLETAGAHPKALERLLPEVAHLSLDLKLSGDLAAPVELAQATEPAPAEARGWARTRERVLALAAAHVERPGRTACAKLVVTRASDREEAADALGALAAVAPRLPLFLQPASPVARVQPPSLERLAELWERALGLGLDVRCLPQVHRLLGLP